MIDMEQMLATGQVKSSHGLDGFLKVKSFSGSIDHFSKLKEVVLSKGETKRTFSVEAVRKAGTTVLLKLQGIDTIDDAKRFASWTVWVDRKKAAPLKRKEYYIADLAGCTFTTRGKKIGDVIGVCESENGVFLEAQAESGIKVLIPFTKHHIGKIDMKNRCVELLGDDLFG